MGKKILVIDDETEILELMEGWLTHVGYQVITAANGDDAFWKIKSEKPDLIILDALIPGRTGHQILEDIKRQSEPVRRIPVIMMSGRQSMQYEAKQVFAFISKPFDPKEFLEKIKKALNETE